MRVMLMTVLLVCSLFAGVGPAAGQTDDVTLTVSVVSQSGEPIGDATIEASWDGGSTTEETASNGQAFVDVPEGADVSLSVESENYIRNQPVVVEDASQQEVTVEVARKGELTVTTNDTDGPVEGVRVRLEMNQETVVTGRTGPDGRYTTPAVEQGEYVLKIFKQGYYRNVTRITVDESTSVGQSMRRGTTQIQFRVVDDYFSPPKDVADARVEVSGIGTQRLTGGTVTFTVPVNTRYTVTATGEGYAENETNVFVGERGEDQTVVINRERRLELTVANGRVVVGETVQVTVRDEYDERVEGATVTAGDEEVATTGPDGTAQVPVDAAGDLTIAASVDGVTSNEVVVQGVATATATPETTPTPAATAAGDDSSDGDLPVDVGQPGFTPVIAVIAVLISGLFLARRQ